MMGKIEFTKCYDTVSDYVVFDLETTGFYVNHDEIIQIGAIKIVNRQPIAKFMSYLKPKRKTISKKITEITGITNE